MRKHSQALVIRFSSRVKSRRKDRRRTKFREPPLPTSGSGCYTGSWKVRDLAAKPCRSSAFGSACQTFDVRKYERENHLRGAEPRTLRSGASLDLNRRTEKETRALHHALDDEYKVWTRYDQVIADLDEVPPVSHIRDAEGRHSEALGTLFVCYHLPGSENLRPELADSLACQQSVRRVQAMRLPMPRSTGGYLRRLSVQLPLPYDAIFKRYRRSVTYRRFSAVWKFVDTPTVVEDNTEAIDTKHDRVARRTIFGVGYTDSLFAPLTITSSS